MQQQAVFDRIRALGFRRWYERQLIEAHVWLIGCVLALVVFVASLELSTIAAGRAEWFFDAVVVVASALAAWYAWRRYAWLMLRAQAIAEQAVCAQCRHDGFRAADIEGVQLRVRCPKCGHDWLLDDPSSAL